VRTGEVTITYIRPANREYSAGQAVIGQPAAFY
jgi:hypothetical protein